MKQIFILFLFACAFASCGDDTEDSVTYKNGVFVLNEGPFMSGSGTLMFIGDDVDTIAPDIFSRANMDAPIGSIAQSMTIFDSKVYIAVNNASKIILAETETLSQLGSIDIAQPRYFASVGDKLYVSAWGATGSDGAVYQINSDGTLSAPIIQGSGPEGLLATNDRLYIAQGGGFGNDSTLVIVDTDDNTVLSSTVVPANPQSFVQSDNGDIYLLCKGLSDFYDPSIDQPGAIVQIRNEEVINTYPIPAGSSRLAIDLDDEKLYYTSLGVVASFDIKTETMSNLDLETVNPYTLSYDNDSNQLYVGDAKDFSSRGDVLIVNDSGTETQRFTAGIVPTYFYFE